MAYLYQCQVPKDKLQAVVDVFAAELDYLYMESEATIELTTYALPSPTWLHGRAFGATLEIRWESVGEAFDLLLLTEIDREIPAGWALISDNLSSETSQILLWGTHIDHLEKSHHLAGEANDAWIETRLPRPLNYPVSGAPRWVKANVVIYHRHHQPVLTRLVSLEGETHEPQPLW